MANSSIITKIKNRVIKEFIRDDDIVAAIDGSDVTSREKLIGTHIFDYHQNPNTINKVGTFITIQVHIPRSSHKGKVFVNPTLEIWIISHEKHMKTDNIPKVKINRNDYLSQLIDVRLNGRNDFGVSSLYLKSNIEGAFQMDYLYRCMIFEITDLNDSLCDEEG